MNRKHATTLIATLAAAGLLFPTAAIATQDDTCTPQDAVDPTDPVGTPTITIPNPDYVPASTVEHAAQYATEHAYQKETKTVRTKGKHTELVHDWEAWSSPVRWSETPITETGHHGSWKDRGWNYERAYRYVATGAERQGRQTKAAWTEHIPAVGDPTIEVENPDYVPGKPGSPAVECEPTDVPDPEPTSTEPPVDPEPSPAPEPTDPPIVTDPPFPGDGTPTEAETPDEPTVPADPQVTYADGTPVPDHTTEVQRLNPGAIVAAGEWG